MYRIRSARVARVLILSALGAATPAVAQFSPGPNPITGTVGAQTLSSGTGTINAGGAISIASGGAVPLTMTGTSMLVNNGTIQTLGTGRAIDSNSGIANLNITNTGLISSVSTDALRVNTNSAVSLTNSGTIQVTAGGQAIDWAAITSAGNSLTNQATGKITAVGEDAVRPGTNGVVMNAGTISATPTGTTDPSGSDGIDVRTFSGIQVTNTGTISGRHGIATDGSNAGPSTITVTNNTAGLIMAINGSGINIDGVSASVTATVTNQAGATIKGGASTGALMSDGDGIDVDGVLTLTNSGQVLGLGARGAGNNAEGVAAGGGKIVNNAAGVISGDGLGLGGAGNGILIDNSSGGAAVAKTIIENSGLIEGKSGFGIRIVGSSFDNEVTNNAGGTIRGTGASAGAALQTGDGSDSVINKGTIVGGNGSALDLQGGDDTLTIAGGAASISGNVSGGAGRNAVIFDLGLGGSFSHSDKISMFATVEAKSGVATVNGANQIDPDATLALSGGTLGITAGGANGQTFASLVLSGDSSIDLHNSTSLTFSDLGVITAGKMLAILGYDPADSPDYAIRFSGNLTADPDFLALMSVTRIDGRVAFFDFDGAFTNVFIPAPSTLAAMGLGLVLLGLRGSRSGSRRPRKA